MTLPPGPELAEVALAVFVASPLCGDNSVREVMNAHHRAAKRYVPRLTFSLDA